MWESIVSTDQSPLLEVEVVLVKDEERCIYIFPLVFGKLTNVGKGPLFVFLLKFPARPCYTSSLLFPSAFAGIGRWAFAIVRGRCSPKPAMSRTRYAPKIASSDLTHVVINIQKKPGQDHTFYLFARCCSFQ